MHGSRSRHVGGHPSEWSPTEHLYPAAGGGPLHGSTHHTEYHHGYGSAPSNTYTGFYDHHHHHHHQPPPEQLSSYQELSPPPGYFGGPGPGGHDLYQPMTPNVALRIFSIDGFITKLFMGGLDLHSSCGQVYTG